MYEGGTEESANHFKRDLCEYSQLLARTIISLSCWLSIVVERASSQQRNDHSARIFEASAFAIVPRRRSIRLFD